jgi:hypothetical protein
MNEFLKRIYNACEPYEPATPEYYYDCAEVRGHNALAQRFLSHLNLSDDNIRFLFSGHVGSGKSSELEQLRHALANPTPPCKRYFPVLLNIIEYLDDFDVAPSDILLAIVTEMSATLRKDAGIELKDNYFVKRINEFKSALFSDVEINEAEVSLGVLKTTIQRLRRDPVARDQVRAALEPRMSRVLEEVNLVFDRARLEIKKLKVKAGEQPYTDFVLILDNLEKIQRTSDKKEGLEAQRELFLERAPQLTALKAHVIYTVPLQIARSDGPQLKQRYGVEPFVLPMIKIFERGTTQMFPDGDEIMRALLQKRLGDLSLTGVFEEAALEFLLKYSGGHVRSLMTFVQEACSYATSLPITLEAAHRAIQQTARTYSTAILESHWAKLAQLDRSDAQKIENGDQDYLLMLEQLSVLEYMDGGDGGPFEVEDVEPWYAVNPIVRELQKFKAAAAALSRISTL